MEGKQDVFGFYPIWQEMKENEGLGGLRRPAVLDRRVREHQRRQESF